MRRSLSNEAQADLEAASDWYPAAVAFAAATTSLLELNTLQAFPDMGVGSPHKTRVLTSRKFPYRLFYQVFLPLYSYRRDCTPTTVAAIFAG